MSENVKMKNYVVDGFYLCNMKEAYEMNNKIYERNIPSRPLEPSINARPVCTKYATLPIVDFRVVNNQVPIKQYPTYNPHQTFNPGNAQAPWSGFASNVNVYSQLRNQFFALQRSDNGDYIPSSQSDLYNTKIPCRVVPQSHSLLFQRNEYETTGSCLPDDTMSLGLFNNHTRQQMYDTWYDGGMKK